jgi:hypothetical protein
VVSWPWFQPPTPEWGSVLGGLAPIIAQILIVVSGITSPSS